MDINSEKQVEIKIRVWRDKLGKWEDEQTIVARLKEMVTSSGEAIKAFVQDKVGRRK